MLFGGAAWQVVPSMASSVPLPPSVSRGTLEGVAVRELRVVDFCPFLGVARDASPGTLDPR